MRGFDSERTSGRRMGGGGGAVDTISDAVTDRGEDGMLLAERYRVVKRLGEGGMGSVWLAEDLKLDGKRFAVKMLPAPLAGKKGAYKQVKAEAVVAMKLSHPNIATVRAFEEDEGGNPFLVMDYIEGTGLDEMLAERGPLGEAETRRILGPVAAALDYAHSQGVVHRDVKPGNVVVRKDGVPFVLDFGIAREIQETMSKITGKSNSGTLPYMSPEQLNGGEPKAAQDVYSFAAMAYECLTGATPFSRGQIEWQIVNTPPAPLEEGVAEAALRAGVMAGLAKTPEERPGTCAGVLGGVDGRGLGGGAGTPCEPVAQDSLREGNAARAESSPQRAGTGEGDAFLRKVRLEKGLEAAGKEAATEEERGGLAKIQELHTAGEEALQAGRDGAAAVLFKQGEDALAAWRSGRETRRRRAREEAEAREREEAERQRKEAEEQERKRREEEALADRTRPAGATKTILLPNGGTMEMAWCPPGSFRMGSPTDEEGRDDDETPHRVTLTQGFWMGNTPVTQEQWNRVTGTNPSCFGGDDLPVETVSWEDCQTFVQALNARCRPAGLRWALPTEAQWEYACRAGTTGAYGGTGRLEDMGWYLDNSGEGTCPVGRKEPNAWGLYDMHGNVWEWCADWYGEYPRVDVADPTGPSNGTHRVFRGGSWRNSASRCRSAYRPHDVPDYRFSFLGLRVVLVPVS